MSAPDARCDGHRCLRSLRGDDAAAPLPASQETGYEYLVAGAVVEDMGEATGLAKAGELIISPAAATALAAAGELEQLPVR